MEDVTPQILPPSAYNTGRGRTVEHLEVYGPERMHPTHLGDRFHAGRYVVAHKLDFEPGFHHSWLVRDRATSTWRRLDISLAVDEQRENERQTVERMIVLRKDYPTAEAADAEGLPIGTFYHRGPNGLHLCAIFPLNDRYNLFRWSLRDSTIMSEEWFVRRCGVHRKEQAEREGREYQGLPASVHEMSEQEMLTVLGRPRIVMVEEAVMGRVPRWRLTRPDVQLPRYVVLRPDEIPEEMDYWLSPEPFDKVAAERAASAERE
ncbi:hypothetical protein C8A05DRAFT_31790 [Staphylotrichum tortipilum]|uniref:Uncharacterized protein n=1 Tax=Staphylotrichum tortipilum TaxID=2831512 RepID=A0AAN6MR22_9PEZI|nr:hypothetical protein C8A05DRAFT_31790 [Staphylotrichum longicolle]